MATTPFDSALYRDLFHDPEIGSLFSDSAEVRAMMLVEGALAKVQGQLGVIPEISGAFIERSAREIQIDPGGLAKETGQNGIPVPALVAAMRKAMEAPEHAQYLHWGATTQDIMDTALMLRLRQVLALLEKRLAAVLDHLAELAQTHADLPMAGRTWMQVATPTSFGAVVAGWGLPLLQLQSSLAGLRNELLCVSLSGAAGTGAAMEPKAAEVRAALAAELRLADPEISWHSNRAPLAAFSGWAAQLVASLGRIGEDCLILTSSEVVEIQLGGGGASSTMPQKQNPVGPSLLSALAGIVLGANGVMQSAAVHRQQRDAAAWMTEWAALPQVAMGAGRALAVAETMLAGLSPVAERMRANLDDGRGLIYAEALQFALTDRLSRPEAQAAVKELCAEVIEEGGSLGEVAKARWSDADFGALFTPEAQLGQAPAEARHFAKKVRG